MLTKNIFTYRKIDDLLLQIEVYQTKTNQTKTAGTILYFHGGGLLWGNRNDLPLPYIEAYCRAGWHFATVDYRLAPETSLPNIYEDIQDAVRWANEFTEIPKPIVLMGRSAGAYLAYLAVGDTTLPNPMAFISFYGYHRIDLPFYTQPNPAYFKYPFLSQTDIEQMIQSKEIISAPIETRYALYLNDRKLGTWLNHVLPNGDATTFSIDNITLKKFPPTFLAHSKADEDVPYEISQQNSQVIPCNQLFTVENLQHDFDADLGQKIGIQTHLSAISFLSKINKSENAD